MPSYLELAFLECNKNRRDTTRRLLHLVGPAPDHVHVKVLASLSCHVNDGIVAMTDMLARRHAC